MEITEVRVKLLAGRSDRLRAFCSMTIDDEFVVHDLRVIDGRKGMFVAMPSRKLSDNCPECGGKNHLRAEYCNDCGTKLDGDRADDRDKYHVDVAHPIVTPCREKVQSTVLEAYREEAAKSDEVEEVPGPEETVESEGEETEQVEETEESEAPTPEEETASADTEPAEQVEEEEQPEEQAAAEQEKPEEEKGEVEEEPDPASESTEEVEETKPVEEETEVESEPSVPEESTEESEEEDEEEAEEQTPQSSEDEDEGGFGAGIF